jgi:hypothetical protein
MAKKQARSSTDPATHPLLEKRYRRTAHHSTAWRCGRYEATCKPANPTLQRYWGLTNNPLGGNYTRGEPRDMISECSDGSNRIRIWA